MMGLTKRVWWLEGDRRRLQNENCALRDENHQLRKTIEALYDRLMEQQEEVTHRDRQVIELCAELDIQRQRAAFDGANDQAPVEQIIREVTDGIS